MNSSRLWLLAYTGTVIAITCIHQPLWLAAALIAALAAAGPGRWQLLKRSLFAFFAFNLSISLAYAGIAWWQGQAPGAALLLINIRVLLLVFLGFWLVSRIDLLAAVAGWPTLSLILTLSIGQIRVYARILADFRQAFASRNLNPPRLADTARQAAAQGGALLDKSLANAGEVALAMRSRGAFDA